MPRSGRTRVGCVHLSISPTLLSPAIKYRAKPDKTGQNRTSHSDWRLEFGASLAPNAFGAGALPAPCPVFPKTRTYAHLRAHIRTYAHIVLRFPCFAPSSANARPFRRKGRGINNF